MAVWIKQPRLWEAIARKTAEEIPAFTAEFWRTVMSRYLDKGGHLQEDEHDFERG